MKHPPVHIRDAGERLRIGAEGPVQEASCRVRVVIQPQTRELHPVEIPGGDVDGGLVWLQGFEDHGPRQSQSGAGPHLQGVRQVAKGVSANGEAAPLIRDEHGPVPGRVGEATDSLEWEPRLRPAARRHWVEAGLGNGIHRRAGGILDEEASGLELDVLPVGVGKEIVPDAALPGQSPEPELLARHVLVPGPVTEPVVLVVIVAAEEVVQLAHHVIRLMPLEGVVAVERQVAALLVHGPRLLLARMLEIAVPRHGHLQVVLCEGRRRHPVVVGLLQGRRVVPENVGLEIRPVSREADLHPPMGPGGQVHAPNPTTHASVGVFDEGVVDRRGG